MKREISFNLNDKDIVVETDELRRLIDVLRDDIGILGTKEGCGEGECGACMVFLDGRIVNSCLVPMSLVENRRITTIEGFRETERFKILEEAFQEAGAVQCGYCTPGMIMAGASLLIENPRPSEDEIRIAISGNLCRCTGYNMIVKAIRLASHKGVGLC